MLNGLPLRHVSENIHFNTISCFLYFQLNIQAPLSCQDLVKTLLLNIISWFNFYLSLPPIPHHTQLTCLIFLSSFLSCWTVVLSFFFFLALSQCICSLSISLIVIAIVLYIFSVEGCFLSNFICHCTSVSILFFANVKQGRGEMLELMHQCLWLFLLYSNYY